MKLKSLILGSVAAAGLSTAGFAADLGVLTSLDVCDALGLSGLTVSSDTNCLQISGSVSYEFNWGDFEGAGAPLWSIATRAGNVDVPNNGPTPAVAGFSNDWNSKVEAWLKFVGTADSDFGPAKATIKLKSVSHRVVTDGALVAPGKSPNGVGPGVLGAGGDETFGWTLDEAFVSVGDTTVIMAGKKGSIANFGDDVPLNWLGLFNSDKVDKGVMFAKDQPKTGGHVIQVVSDLGNGVNVGLGLENLDSAGSGAFAGAAFPAVGGAQGAGTLVGVVNYAGNGITAHVTGLAGGILDGVVENWAAHAGINGKFDMFEVIAAGAFSSNTNGSSYWNVLGSAAATFDMFKIAISGEANGGYNGPGAVALATQVGFGGSVSATVTEGVSINLGGRWFDEDNSVAGDESYQIAAQLVAAITETLSVSGTVGYYGTNKVAAPNNSDFYGAVGLDWKPGGGFTSSVAAEAHQSGAYKVTFKAAKSFE